MKTIREVLADLLPARRVTVNRHLLPALLLAAVCGVWAAEAAPANDNFASAITLAGANGATNGNNAGATLESCEARQINTDDQGVQSVTNSVWFAWKPSVSGPIEFDTIGSSFNTAISVWTGSSLCSASFVAADYSSGYDWDPNGLDTSLLDFYGMAGTTYYIAVESQDDGTFTGSGGSGNIILNWRSTPANDNFASATVLSGASGSTNGNNYLATMESCESNTVVAYNLNGTVFSSSDPITNTVWFVWKAPANGTVQFNTSGSSFINLLSVWTDTNATPTLCDGTITNVTAYDSQANAVDNTEAQVVFTASKGTNYYIAVGSSPGFFGTYVLGWGPTNSSSGTSSSATLVSGPLGFTAGNYIVSQSDSSSPNATYDDNDTISSSVLGARITVTRPAPAFGRVLVDYVVSQSTYLNTFSTNYWGTNVLTVVTNMAMDPVTSNYFFVSLSYTNVYSTNIYIANTYQSQTECGLGGLHGTQYFDEYLTNSATQIMVGVYNVSNAPVTMAFDNVTNFPVLTNYLAVSNVTASGFADTFSTNIFGYLANSRVARSVVLTNGTTLTNNSVIYANLSVTTTLYTITNFFGTNISLTYQSTTFNGPFYNTNFYFVNQVVESVGTTNMVYTNGLLKITLATGATNWDIVDGSASMGETILTASNYLNSVTPLQPQVLSTVSVAPLGNYTIGQGSYVDANSNGIAITTNSFSYQVTTSQTVPSGNGITLETNTIALNNLQMSADIMVPVSTSLGPDAPVVDNISGLAYITLFNARLDTNEDSVDIAAPSISTSLGSATINALSPNYDPDTFYLYTNAPGWFNLERSTFRGHPHGTNHTAVICVNRFGTNTQDSVSVDYVLTPARTTYYPYGFSPANGTPATTEDSIVACDTYNNGKANSFPLQAGSDYATPNSDYAPVASTLTWPAYDMTPKTISIPLTNSGAINGNLDILVQLHNPSPIPASANPGMTLGLVNSATFTILQDDQTIAGGAYPGQQPSGACDRSWNRNNYALSTPPNLNYPGTTPGVGGTVYAAAEQADGKVVIGGSFVSYDGFLYNHICRLTTDGYADVTSFQGNSSSLGNNSGANGTIDAVAIQADGRILIGGNFTAYNGANRHYIARLNTDGSLDSTFAPGSGANGTVWAIAYQASGQIVIGGDFSSYNGTAVSHVARINADGSLDTTFNPGSGPDGTVNAVAVDGSGRVVIGGVFSYVSGLRSGGVARLNTDGSADTTFVVGIGTFNPDTYATDPVHAVAIQADGKILIGGSFEYYGLVNYYGLARLNKDGTLDLNFGSGTGTLNPVTGVVDTVYTIQLDAFGDSVIGGNFVAYNQTVRYGVARVYPDGSLDTTFMDRTYNQYAGIPNPYFNGNYVSPTYPYYNTRGAIYAIALEYNPNTTLSNIVVGGFFEQVGGGATRDSVLPRSNVARLIGGSSPGPGNIELVGQDFSIEDNAGSKYVSLIRTNGNLGSIGADFTATTAAPGPGVATAGTDFWPTAATPIWVTTYSLNENAEWLTVPGEYWYNYNELPSVSPSSAAAGVTINVTNVNIGKGNLSAKFGLSAPFSTLTMGGEYIPVGAALGSQMSAPFTIIDTGTRPGVLGFSAPTYSAIENGSVATITITRTNGSQGNVNVGYITTDGTGISGTDYTGVTNSTFTLVDGQTNATFSVVTLNKVTSARPDKTVNLTLYTPSGGATLGLSNAVLTLVNSKYTAGHLSFSATNYTVAENGGGVVVTVNRLGGSATTLGVTVITRDGTAFNGTNYVGSTNTFSWDANDATSRTFTVPVMDDGIPTANLVAYLRLTNSMVNGTNSAAPLNFGNAASPTNATITIANVDSAGTLEFSAGAYSVKKYAGYALIPVDRVGGSIGTVSVNFTTLDGTALQGVNYTSVTNTLTFTNGQLSQLVNVPINGQANPNGLRTLTLQLDTNGLSTVAALGTPSQAPLYIIDTAKVDETPGAQDQSYSPFAGMNGPIFALAIETNSGNQLLVGGKFTMANGVTRNNIARLNSDGSLDANFSLPADNYGAGDTVRTLAVQTDNRILVGGAFTNFNGVARGHVARLNADGTLDSTFNPGAGADNSIYAVAQTFVNGNPVVLIAGAFASVNGETFNGIGRLNTDGTPDTTFNAGGAGANATVYAMVLQPDGKIVIGGDFTTYNGNPNFNHIARLNVDGTVDTNFNVSASGPNGSVRALALQLDGRIVIGGLFTNVNGVAAMHVARLNPNGSVDSSFNAGLGADEVVFSIALQADTRIVLGGAFTSCSGVTRNRITRLNPDGSVDPSINFGTGANDYVSALAIQDDSISGYPTNVPDEKIILGGGFTLYNSATNNYLARVFGGSIGGSGAFQFSAPTYQVHETGTNVLVTVLRTGGTTNAATGDVFVTAATSNGSAVAGNNYVAVSTNLDFGLGEVVKSFQVAVMDDGLVTSNLTVNLAISNPTTPAQIGDQPTAILSIINDDAAVCFSNSIYSVGKNTVSGVAAISILRLGGTNSTTSVYFSTTGGTAIPGTDYTPTAGLVTFNPGVTNVVVNIPINNNGIAEGNQTVTMQLTPVPGTALVLPTNAVLTIIDTVNAPGNLSFDSAGYTVTEGGTTGYTNVAITIDRTYGWSGTVSVDFTTQDGTAVAGTKYLATNGVVNFADGETSKTIDVQVKNTATAEGPESFNVYLYSPNGGASLLTPTNTVVTILNTNTGVAFASATSEFTEPSGLNEGYLQLNVIRYNNTNGITTVGYATTNGSAVSGVNFQGTNGVITFMPGVSVQPITIETFHDTNVTGDLFFTVGLSSPNAGAQLTAPSFTVVTDHDAEARISLYTSTNSVYRNVGYVPIFVTNSNPSVEPFSVNYSTFDGSALAGSDYTAESGTLTFTNGEFYNYFYVPILLNNGVQTNRQFTVVLSGATSPGVLDNVSVTTETINIIGTNTPSGLSFSTPVVIGGQWGTSNVDNTLGAPESGDPSIAGQVANAPVWFKWTAPAGMSGEVTMDTIGSAATNGAKLDTLMEVYTGTSLDNLNQVAANDDLFTLVTYGQNGSYSQYNYVQQNIFNTNPIVMTNYSYYFSNGLYVIYPFSYITNSGGEYQSLYGQIQQPFSGPSGLRFNARGGQTYYIAVDTKYSYNYVYANSGGLNESITVGRGNIQLNWAYHPAGVFRFATEDYEVTGITQTNGNPLLLYQCAETEGEVANSLGNRIIGPTTYPDDETTYHAYYQYDVAGLLVTVTRVAGASGRMMVDYRTVDGDTNIISNGDLPAVAGRDYLAVSNTLIFDDFEMSKTIRIPIVDDQGLPYQHRQNRDFSVVLSNPRRDPVETTSVSPPRVDPVFGQVLCRILDADIDPRGPTTLSTVYTNLLGSFTNTSIADQNGYLYWPTNALFNFSKSHYRVVRDVHGYWGSGTPVTVYVNRNGTNTSSVTVHYRFDNFFLDQDTIDDDNNEFPLQAGSDYAVPTPAGAGAIHGTNSDFAGAGGDSGSMTFPGGNKNPYQSLPIHFNISNNHIPGFNKDILISLYVDDANNNPYQPGMVSQATVTILFDDTFPTAGSVDQYYNPDFATDLAILTNSDTLYSSVYHPGTDPLGTVYSVVLTTNGQAVIGGAFYNYTDSTNTYTVNGITRLNNDGSLDTTFNVGGSGVNVSGGDFIRSVALTADGKAVIGGRFTSFNGTSRNYVARLNADGTLDTGFNPGAGANGQVWSVLVQGDGKVLIGGEFTKYNGTTANYVARLNTDGTLDSTFSSSNLLSGPVYAMALPPSTVLTFDHTASGGPQEDVQTLNLASISTGTLTVSYNMFVVPDDMRIFYGTTNTVAGTGVLLYDTGNIPGNGTIVLPFGPTNGFTANTITIVMNQGGSTNSGTAWTYNASVSVPTTTGLLVGGKFAVNQQSYANIARLNADGSLDSSFNPGTGPDNSVLALAWQLDNKVLLGGAFQNVSGNALNYLARLNSDGTVDSGFYIGTGMDNSVNSISLQPLSGLSYVGGDFTVVNGTHRLGLARLYSDGTVDTTFLDTAYNQFAGLPRILYADAPGVVYSTAVQGDGNVLIGGSFQQVGGGQADYAVRDSLEEEHGLLPSMGNSDLWVSEGGLNLEPKTRDGLRNRNNIARLIGGATPGPGNIGMVNNSFTVNRTQVQEPVNLVRNNGFLGYASANFTVSPQLAQSGTDYSYSGVPPIYPVAWEYSGLTRMHSDGMYGQAGQMIDFDGELFKWGLTGPASILINIMNSSVAGNLSASLQLANPAQMDQFYLGGQNIPIGVALGISKAPLTLIDNSHEDGVFGFSSTNYVATNSTASVTVVRTNGTSGSVQLNYQTTTSGSTALLGADYRATNGVLTFAAGQTSSAFPITILNSGSSLAQEKDIVVQLYNIQDLSGGAAQLGVTNAVVRLINPNFAGYLSFSANSYLANLSAGVVNFTVTRTVGGKGTLTVQYGTTDATARNGVDYVGSTNTLTWNDGDVSSRVVSIPLINNGNTGGFTQFRASLFNATLNGVAVTDASLFGSITNSTLRIFNDNSYGTFQLSASSYQYNENGGFATITVTRTGSTLGTAAVSYTTANGTALAGTNYVATSSSLTFTNGQVAASFRVPLLDDGKVDPSPANFYFNVDLTGFTIGAQGAKFGTPTNALVHIVDAESYNQQPGALDPTFDPTASLNASVLALAMQSNGDVVAGGSFTVASGTSINRVARFNTDGTLDTGFMNGLAGPDGTVNAIVDQTDDRLLLGGTFLNVDGLGRQYVARLMTDGTLDSSFNPGSGADSAVYALAETFINGVRRIYVGGAFSTYNGTSSPGVVRLNNNGLMDTSFNVGLGAVGAVYAVAVYPTNSVANAGQLLVAGSFTNFNGVVVGNLVRLNADGSLDTNFSQNASASGAVRALAIQLDGEVLIGGDFTNVNHAAANHLARLNADGSLDTAFMSAAASGINGSVDTIALQQDGGIILGGQFTLANGVTRGNVTRLLPSGAVDPTINFGTGANAAVNAAVVQPADAKIVIGGSFTAYNGQARQHIARIFGGSIVGSGAFQFTSAGYQIDENANFAAITIIRTGGTSGTNTDGSGDVHVAFATVSGGSAVPGTNYTYVTNYIDFPVGEVLRTVQVPVQDDGVITTNLTVNLALSNPTKPGTTLGDQANAVLTIINDDSTVEFASATYSVPKNVPTGLAEISIARSGSSSGSCTVFFATGTNGTAVAGLDYTPTNGLVTFYAGDTNEIIEVGITNNLLPEGARTVTMVLSNAANTVLSSPSNAVLTILDTTTNPGSLFFTATNYNANSGDAFAYLTVSRTNGTYGSVSVKYMTVSLYPATNAATSQDYTTVTNGAVNFTAGDSSEVIQIPLINNPVPKGPVMFEVELFNPTSAGLLTPSNSLVTIMNTNAAIEFVSATNFVSEDANSLSVIVERINNTNIVSSVHYATVDGTDPVTRAVAGTNYVSTSGELYFGLGETFKSFNIPLINRSNLVNLTFGVTLSNAINGTLIIPSNTVVVLEGSAAGFSFTTNLTTVAKAGGLVYIPVICSNPRVEPTNGIQVAYVTADGTAKAGINYVAASGTLNFVSGPNAGTNFIPVQILNNPPFGNQTFSVMLTNVTGPGYITPIGTNTVLITESGVGFSFSQSLYSAPENAGQATIDVYRTGYTDSVVSVNYVVTNGTAIAGQNFYPASGTLLFTNGVTDQSFNVTLIANSQPLGNVFALMELNTNNLSGDAGVQIVKPGTATLSILKTGGSYVVPAGALLATNSSALDASLGVIGSNDVVAVKFAFRDAAGQNVTNLVAYLQATNGVASPSPAFQSYSNLTVYGHSVSRVFSFTAKGTNSYTISPTFKLYDGGSNGTYIGMATFTFTLGTWPTTFANTNMIIINPNLTGTSAGAAASPYPSIIQVTNVGTTLVKATVTLTNLSLQSIYDVGALVVSPTTNTLLMGHVSASGASVKHITLTFDDGASNSLPVGVNTSPTTSTNRPTQKYPMINFP